MIRKLLAVAGTAAVVAAAALGGTALANDDTASPSTSPSASPSASVAKTPNYGGIKPVHISGAQDDGTAGKVWANLDFTRTTEIVDSGYDGPGGDATHAWYDIEVTDDGTFFPLAGAPSPREGVEVQDNVKKGTFHGVYKFHLSVADPAYIRDAYGDELNEGCTSTAGQARTCQNRVSNEAWLKGIFKSRTGGEFTLTPGDWEWTYKTACETWVDNSTTGGKSAEDGDITGAKCDTPPPDENPITDKVFQAQNVCRVKIDGPAGYVVQKANVWTITNRSGKAYKVHTAVTYGGKRTWFGWDNRGAVQPHSSLTVVSPYGGQLAVEISGYGNLPENTWATATSDHTVLCG
jgi:hypothetical protein